MHTYCTVRGNSRGNPLASQFNPCPSLVGRGPTLDSRPLSIEKDGLVYTVCACVNCPQDSWDGDHLSSQYIFYNDVIAQITAVTYNIYDLDCTSD